MRRDPHDHDKVYSGAMTAGSVPRKWAFICRRCGEVGYDLVVDVSRVNADEYYAQQVAHGWATPEKIPGPPRLPRKMLSREPSLAYAGMLTFGILFFCCAMAGASGAAPLGPALIATGTCLLMFVMCWMVK